MWKNWEIRCRCVKVSATKRMLFCVSALKSFVSEDGEKKLHMKKISTIRFLSLFAQYKKNCVRALSKLKDNYGEFLEVAISKSEPGKR